MRMKNVMRREEVPPLRPKINKMTLTLVMAISILTPSNSLSLFVCFSTRLLHHLGTRKEEEGQLQGREEWNEEQGKEKEQT